MFPTDPRGALLLVHEHTCRLRAQTAPKLLRPTGPRRVLAASLRRAADRLDRSPLRYRAA
jgi:hypothetical protein